MDSRPLPPIHRSWIPDHYLEKILAIYMGLPTEAGPETTDTSKTRAPDTRAGRHHFSIVRTRESIMTKTTKVRPYERKEAITPIEYGGLQQAYDHFNATLFDGTLPDVFITYQRRANSAGYFAPDRFSGRSGKFVRRALALNPDGLIGRVDQRIVHTLRHATTQVSQPGHRKRPLRRHH